MVFPIVHRIECESRWIEYYDYFSMIKPVIPPCDYIQLLQQALRILLKSSHLPPAAMWTRNRSMNYSGLRSSKSHGFLPIDPQFIPPETDLIVRPLSQ